MCERVMREQSARELYENYGHLIFNRCRQLLGCEDQAKDALQECMIKLIKQYPKFKDPEHVVPWVYRMVKNHCLNELRKRKKFVDNIVLEKLPVKEELDFESRELLRLLLAVHSKKVQDAVYYTYIEEMSQEEIRSVTGQSPATIRRNLSKFRESIPTLRKRAGLE